MHQDVRIAPTKWIAAILLTGWLCNATFAALAQRVAKVVAKQEPSEYAIQVIEPGSGTTVYRHNATKSMMPASNMKLITTAAALKYLGASFEYRTVVGLCGDTLVIVGSGDPLLGDAETDKKYGRQTGWIFEKIAQSLQEQGVKEINDIVVDTTIFDNQRVHPSWPARDYNKWYACEVCGLNYNGNCIDVSASNSEGVVAVSVNPPTAFVEIINQVEPITSGEGAVGALRNVQPNRITVFGKCATRVGPFRVAIEQPAAFFGFVLAEHLGRSGIVARGRLIEKARDESCTLKPVTEFVTPLSDVLNRANTDSLGLAAEALLKTIDAHSRQDRKDASWAGGRELVGRYLTGLGVSADEFVIDDGSGLSRQNRLTTNAISKVLLDMYKNPNWEMFRTSLAVGGEQGTINKYFSETKYRGRIVGKTGYISGVKSFSGLCATANGPYLFSIITNGPKGLSRDAINDIAKAIIDEYGPEAKAK